MHCLLPVNTTGAYSLQCTDASFSPQSCLPRRHKPFTLRSHSELLMLEGLTIFRRFFSWRDQVEEWCCNKAGMKVLRTEPGMAMVSILERRIGIVFDWLRDQTAGYGSDQFISAGVGLRYRVNEKLMAGWAWFTLLRKIGKTNRKKRLNISGWGSAIIWRTICFFPFR
jgi:hypothetical protein